MPETFSDVSQFDTFASFYAISNFYFLLNISVTHRPRITNTFVLVHSLYSYRFVNPSNNQSTWSRYSYPANYKLTLQNKKTNGKLT